LKKEQEKILENVEQKESGEVSRRDFLVGAGTVVVGGAIGAGLLSGCGETVTTTVKETSTKTIPTTITAPGTTETKTVAGPGGEVITVTETKTEYEGGGAVEPAFETETTVIKPNALSGVAGGDLMAVDVKNGKIIRCRPVHWRDHVSQEQIDASHWKYEVRGHVFESLEKSQPAYLSIPYKKRVYGRNRILYPLKRVDWDPSGERNPQNRGISKYKRISWEQATDIVASEIKRVTNTYGKFGILACADGHGENKALHNGHDNVKGSPNSLLGLANGGFTSSIRNADSWEGWNWGTKHVWGEGNCGMIAPSVGMFARSWLLNDVQNIDMIVWAGGDYETTPTGFRGRYYSREHYFLDAIGIKHVYVCPELNYAAAVHADRWIPVLPNTDVAWMLGVAYVWITEDLYDKDYIATHTVGFDDYIKPYVMGEIDDEIPKTPEWAAVRSGIPEWTIKALARDWASKRTSMGHYFGGSMIRGPYSHEPARMVAVLLSMQGLGGVGVHQFYGSASGPPRVATNPGIFPLRQGYSKGADQIISKVLVPHAIMNGSSSQWSTTSIGAATEDQFVKYEYPLPAEQGGTEVHMIMMSTVCHTTCWNNGFFWHQAFRNPKIETIVAQHMHLENDCVFADIILPVNTYLEELDEIATTNAGIDRVVLALCEPAVNSIGESMSDYEVNMEIAKKLDQATYDQLRDGKTIEEWMKWGFEKSGAQNFISWEEFQEKKMYIAPIAEDYKEDIPGMRKFYEDPDNNPLATPSGKLELYSQRLADYFPDDKERKPYPTWVVGGPASEGWHHDESLWGERCKTYPYLIVSNHPRWRSHANCDDITWLREIPTCKVKGYDGYMYEPLWIHPTDADKKGIKSGDIVKIFNERGIVLGGAYVTERIKPGVVYQDHGARVDLITDKIDRAGANNLLSPRGGVSTNCWGNAQSGYLVDFEKLDPAEMEEWRMQYPAAFARKYDPADGLQFEAWIEGEE